MTIRERKPRVALLIPHLGGGGAQRAALTVAAHSSMDCRVVAEGTGGELFPLAQSSSTQFVSTDTKPALRPRRIARLARELRRNRPDLAVSFLSPLVHHAAARLAGVPLMHWIRAAPGSWFDLAGKGVRARTEQLVLRSLLRRSVLVACVSPGIGDELRGLGVPESRIVLLPGPIDLSRASAARSQRRPHDGRAQIVTVSALGPPKRPDLLLDAVAALSRDHDLHLTVIGDGPLRPVLEGTASALGIGQRVGFTGWLEDALDLVSSSDVFVLSSDSEGMPSALVEALACGVPIVASDIPHGPRFALEGLPFAELVLPGSAAALAAGISKALRGGALTAAARETALRRAETFGADTVVESFERHVREVLGPPRQTP